MPGQKRMFNENKAHHTGATTNRMRWFREAAFGLFIHWGLYSIPAGVWNGQEIPGTGEHIMYRCQIPVAEYSQFADKFNPRYFNAKDWVKLAKDAGQKYITITAKHHDGFCMFKSDYTHYNIVDATPFGRDICKELAEECSKQNIKLCFYYSQTRDWFHPGGYHNIRNYNFPPEATDESHIFSQEKFDHYIEYFVKPQIREMLTNYGPIGLIWFDTPNIISENQSSELMQLVHELQPDCLVSGRVGNSQGDCFSVGDNEIPLEMMPEHFETPATMNDTWGYKTNDHNWKSTQTLIHNMVDIVSKNGNYLLNIGPTAEGIIPQESIDRLLAMGEWLKVNGEAIYDCDAGPIQGVDDIRSTQKGKDIFLHLFKLPHTPYIEVEFPMKIAKVCLLMNGTVLKYDQTDGKLRVYFSNNITDPILTVIKITIV